MRTASIYGLALALVAGAACADPIPAVQSASNMQIIGHSDLNGAGHGGEGLALRQYPDGRRVLFLAHFNAGVRALDIRDPYHPREIGYFVPKVTAATESR